MLHPDVFIACAGVVGGGVSHVWDSKLNIFVVFTASFTKNLKEIMLDYFVTYSTPNNRSVIRDNYCRAYW